MNYQETLDFIINYPRFSKTKTMSRMGYILSSLGKPQNVLRFIHIAGTNGKGSVSAMCASILRTAGYKTGLFISPFIEDFRERITVDGELMSKTDMAEIFTTVRGISESCETLPNAFEIITSAALAYYAKEKCDVVVLETGLGGTWDATNIIPAPDVAAITSISLDHTRILGNTIEEIATEKCGILKNGSHAVTCGDQNPNALAIIKRVCEKRNIPLTITDENNVYIINETIRHTDIIYNNKSIRIPFAGRHQIQNALIVIETSNILKSLCYNITDLNIAEGISSTRFPVRMEVVAEDPLIIIDGAHNIGGIEALCNTAERLLPDKKITTIFGCLGEKNLNQIINRIVRISDTIFIVKPDSARAEDIRVIEHEVNKHSVEAKSFDFLIDAITKAKNRAKRDGAIIICGSLYLAGEARTILTEEHKT